MPKCITSDLVSSSLYDVKSDIHTIEEELSRTQAKTNQSFIEYEKRHDEEFKCYKEVQKFENNFLNHRVSLLEQKVNKLLLGLSCSCVGLLCAGIAIICICCHLS